jgi:catechol 1,2-dioxygenase
MAPARGAECRVAPVTNILGPAYRAGAPFRTRLSEPNEPGMALTMRGAVVDAESCQPLDGSVLDIWQVDARGNYDEGSADFHLRGRFKTDSNGGYVFATIMPVPYGKRPKHIHYLITHPGYEPRITQCYFDGDERNAKDHYVKKGLIVTPVASRSVPSTLEATFDIALERERLPSADARHVYPEFAGNYRIEPGATLTVRAEGTRLYWHLNASENDGEPLDGEFMPRAASRFFLPEYDIDVTFVRNDHGQVDHALDSDGSVFPKIG